MVFAHLTPARAARGHWTVCQQSDTFHFDFETLQHASQLYMIRHTVPIFRIQSFLSFPAAFRHLLRRWATPGASLHCVLLSLVGARVGVSCSHSTPRDPV